MDFGLTEDLDLQVEDGVFGMQEDGETTLITAFFTDARVNEQRGYWIDIKGSEIWTYDQSRLTDEVARNLRETAKDIADKLVDEGLYSKIYTDAFISDGLLTLHIMCYDRKEIVVDRKFAV